MTMTSPMPAAAPAARTWTRSLNRRRRALYVSSPIGLGHALRFLMTGEAVSAERACALGLVDEVKPDGELDAAVAAAAKAIAAAAPTSVRAVKRLVRADELGALEQALASEGATQIQALQSSEFQRRLEAFVNR